MSPSLWNIETSENKGRNPDIFYIKFGWNWKYCRFWSDQKTKSKTQDQQRLIIYLWFLLPSALDNSLSDVNKVDKLTTKDIFLKGTSIAIFIYIVNLTIFGFFGLILFLTGQLQNIYLLLCAIVLIFTNPLLNLFHKISQLKIAYNITTIKKIQTLINSVIKNSQTSWKTPHTLIVIGGLIILRILFISIRYYWATLVFNVHIPFVQLMVLTIVIELFGIFLKLSPGNLGIFELLSGTTIGFMGNDMGIGILLALLCRVTNLMLTFTLGLWVMFINFKYLKIVSLKALWEKVYVSAWIN